MAEEDAHTDATTGRGFSTTVLVAVTLVLGVAAAGGGYLLGLSGGADLDAARAEGERIGQAKGSARGAERGFQEGVAKGRRAGYRKTYKRARKAAYEQALQEGQATPAATSPGE